MQLAKKHHPDKGGDKEEVWISNNKQIISTFLFNHKNKFKKIALAYEILGD